MIIAQKNKHYFKVSKIFLYYIIGGKRLYGGAEFPRRTDPRGVLSAGNSGLYLRAAEKEAQPYRLRSSDAGGDRGIQLL